MGNIDSTWMFYKNTAPGSIQHEVLALQLDLPPRIFTSCLDLSIAVCMKNDGEQ